MLPGLHGCRSIEGCATVLFVRLRSSTTSDVPCARIVRVFACNTREGSVHLVGHHVSSQTLSGLESFCEPFATILWLHAWMLHCK
jgi:hypothetical protein